MQPQVILITGASSGIGFDVAQTLAQKGHKVYAAARRVQLMQPLTQWGVVPIGMDVTDTHSMDQAVAQVLQAEDHIDVLVNNAGYGYFGAVEEVPMDEARRQLEVNLFGLAYLCQQVIPHMRQRRSGRIINLSSVAGRMPFLFGGWYNVSKYSVEALSDTLRIELQPFGIHVVKIEPGPIKTNWGIIAADHLQHSSANTAYDQPGRHWANTMRWSYQSNLFSGPHVITQAICRAALSRHPHSRYCAGRFAKLSVAAHALMPTRWWDSLMRAAAKLNLGQKPPTSA